jgi:hypothetical protein
VCVFKYSGLLGHYEFGMNDLIKSHRAWG